MNKAKRLHQIILKILRNELLTKQDMEILTTFLDALEKEGKNGGTKE